MCHVTNDSKSIHINEAVASLTYTVTMDFSQSAKGKRLVKTVLKTVTVTKVTATR